MTASDVQLSSESEIFASNKAMLKRRFPHLAGLLDFYSGQWSKTVDKHMTRSGLPTISVDSGAATVHVHSTFQPVVEAARWAKEPLQSEWNFAVVFGMGLGYHLDELLIQRPECRIVVIEPRADVFCAAMALKDQRRLLSHPYLELVVAEDPVAAAGGLFRSYLQELLADAPVFVWPAAGRYAAEYLKTLESQFVSLVRAFRSDVATRRRFHLQWLNNFFSNVRTAVADPGVSALKGHLANRPAIIVAAGPSLEKNVPLLADAQGKTVIIAAGSAINPLLKNGIEPDLLVSFDAGEANYRHFENLHTPNLPLVYIPTIFPQILEEYKGPRFTAGMAGFPFVGWLFDEVGEDKGLLDNGPSVANVSWHLANVLGLNPIILIGQDLAFTDGKSHAAGAVHAKTVDLESGDSQSRYITTEGIDGSTVTTSVPMYSMKVWFEQRLRNAHPGHVTIDATEGGAKIAGTEIMPLKQAIQQYCRETFNPHQVIMKLHRREQERLRGKDIGHRLMNALMALEDDLNRAIGVSAEGLRDTSEFLRESATRKLTEQRYTEFRARLSRRMRQLNRLRLYTIFVEPAIAHLRQSLVLSTQSRGENDTNLYAKGLGLAKQYGALLSSVNETARHLRRLVRSELETVRRAPAAEHPEQTTERHKAEAVSPTRRITHIAFFTQGNAGDTLLTAVLRELFDQRLQPSSWQGLHAHTEVGDDELSIINRSDLCVIGGGGLFLKDTNPNELSGWQWSCSLDSLERIRKPIVVFAVGYNRFRGQDDFGPAFYDFIPRLVDKALFFGLRNHGSIRAIRTYLPSDLHSKVAFQPCMTTLLKRLYPQLAETPIRSRPFVAVNCAFDRAPLRYGSRLEQILDDIARALKELSSEVEVRYYAHSPSDELMVPVLKKWRVPFTVTRLYGQGPEDVIEAYRTPSLVIGMRGHSQMIPFGCGVPILSLISHDKMAWFLEDIDASDWGMEVGSHSLREELVDKSRTVLSTSTSVREEIDKKQQFLWDVTRTNLEFIGSSLANMKLPK